MKLFPPEIIKHTTQSHFVKNSTKSRVVYTTVIIAIIAALIGLPFIYVDISTQARGIIRTPAENNLLQTVVYGEVQQVFIKENSTVKTGDTLIVLNTDKLKEQILNNRKKQSDNNTFIADITGLLQEKSFYPKTPKYFTELNYFTASLNELQTKIDFCKSELDLAETLYNKDVMPKQEFLQNKNRHDAALGQLNNLKEQFYNKWQAEKTRLLLANTEIGSSIKQLHEEKTKYIITSPANGSIIQFIGIKPGSFISPGQTIAYISNNSELLVECYVSPTDIGYIATGQNVNFQLDAFNYNQWGMVAGKVSEISNDISNINDQPVFRIRCELDNTFLQLNTGYKGYLKKGMTLTGRFYLSRRNLWQLLFDKVDDWMNPKLMES